LQKRSLDEHRSPRIFHSSLGSSKPMDYRHLSGSQLADIRAREDNGSTLAVDLFTETMFDNSPLRLRPNGTVESVSTIKADDLMAYYAKLLCSRDDVR